MENVDSLLIDLSTLKAATHNFHETNKLGEGGFGAVYKVLLFIPVIVELSQKMWISIALKYDDMEQIEQYEIFWNLHAPQVRDF